MISFLFNKKILLIFFVLLLNFEKTNALENKILFKVNNEIITTIDIYNQANYLRLLNPEIDKLDKNKIIEISKNSLIREKVKKIAILQIISEIDVSSEYLEQILISMAKKNGMKTISEYENYLKRNNFRIEDLKQKIKRKKLKNFI